MVNTIDFSFKPIKDGVSQESSRKMCKNYLNIFKKFCVRMNSDRVEGMSDRNLISFQLKLFKMSITI